MRKSVQKPAQKPQPNQAKPKVSQIIQPAEVKPFNPNDYAKDGITKEEVLQFKEAFDIFDHSGSGKVEVAEIKEAFTNLGFHHQSAFTQNLLAFIEKNTVQLDFGEFIRIATARINQDYTQPQTNLVFTAFDQKFTGKFSIYDLKDTIRAVGEDISQEEIEKIFRAADTDSDGYVTSQDFYAIITKKGLK